MIVVGPTDPLLSAHIVRRSVGVYLKVKDDIVERRVCGLCKSAVTTFACDANLDRFKFTLQHAILHGYDDA